MKMNKRPATIAAVILLVLIPAFSTAGEVSWAKLVYDPSVPSQTRKNFQKAIDTMDVLFTKYKIVLNDPITIVVTANNAESFIRALMSYENMSRAQAEHGVKIGLKGLSSKKTSPVIVIRDFSPKDDAIAQGSIDRRHKTAALSILSHELFHQVQNPYCRVHRVMWLEEGSAMLFGHMACQIAGIGASVTGWVQGTEQSIRKAAEIPDTRQLATNDHKDWDSLGEQKYPINSMAIVMTYRLVGDNGFEKVILYYQLLDNGSDPDTAFNTAFGMPMSKFLADMNDYFNKLRSKKE